VRPRLPVIHATERLFGRHVSAIASLRVTDTRIPYYVVAMNTTQIDAIALTIRSLSMDAVEAAGSGHPGLPMGCAELGALLYGEILKHDPSTPYWIDRDRFALSAGHGSMLLYSLLFLSGYGVTLDEIKRFRQVGSPAAGHPERGAIPGIETTTGPLGQGFANSVGLAVAETMLAARFNTVAHPIIDHHTYALAGDGCMMEGVTSEAASLAGHLGLGKLIVFYDSNRTTIDGSTDLAFSEDVVRRFDAYRWHTQAGSAYDIDLLRQMVDAAKAEGERPSLILLESTIGKGAPNLQGTSKAHGAPLGGAEIAAARANLGLLPDDEFYIAPEAEPFFKERRSDLAAAASKWRSMFAAWASANPDKNAEWNSFFGPADVNAIEFPRVQTGEKIATRNAGNKAQNVVAAAVPNLVGGSADLASSNKTAMPDFGSYGRSDRAGRTINFGVREHAMGSITNGIALHGGLRPFAATFLVFADYMRPAIRLASIMELPVIYVFTHDSIHVGEDGPTHQPVEQLQSLRIFPGIWVLRPADALETELAWQMAIGRTDGPVVLGLTRQDLLVFDRPSGWRDDAARGAYVVRSGGQHPSAVVVATGSEVTLALEAAQAVGETIRVVSMFCREIFVEQDEAFQHRIIPPGIRVVVAEAGVSSGWEGVAGGRSNVFGLDRFGLSGKADEVAEHLGLTAKRLAAKLLESR